MSRKSAFTLVELLVVISIIAVLIALLLPGLGRAKHAARLIECASNERQLAIGVHAYANDNRDLFPCYDTAAETPIAPDIWVGNWWAVDASRRDVFPAQPDWFGAPGRGLAELTTRRRLYAYVTADIAACPLDVPGAEPSRLDYFATGVEAYGSSYLYQAALVTPGSLQYVPVLYRAHTGDIQSPSALVMAGDGTIRSADNLEFHQSYREPDSSAYSAPLRWHDPLRYQLNAAFVDGHVKPIEIRDRPEHLINSEYRLVEPGWAVYDNYGNKVRNGSTGGRDRPSR